jgi:ubiquinone/menaquinone biosynthesis C-methylase UbiE
MILDIGSGNAMMRSVLQSACRAERYITSDIAPTDQTAVVCDAQLLPFPDGSMDLVASFEVIEHIPDTERFISEIVRVLRPEGYVVLSMPFLYGRHDFQDFHRWTAQGLERVLNLMGLKVRVIQNRGGTFLTITTLLSNYIHSIFAPSSGSWRTQGIGKKLYFGVMTILMFPLVPLSWLGFELDLLIDRNSANPSGFVCIAQKKGSDPA